MAGYRVVVASRVPRLAKLVQRQLPAVTVEELDYNVESFPQDIKSGKWEKPLQQAEVLLVDCDALLTCLKARATPALKWAQATWAGVDYVIKGLDFKKPAGDFILTRCGGGFGDIMAEYVIGHIIAWERNFAGLRLQQEQKLWNKGQFGEFRPLFTMSIGILGYGSIGKKVAAACKAMGMTVWAVSRSHNTTPSPTVDHFRGPDALGEVLHSCDFVCSILPETPATCNLLSGNVLQQCQERKSVLINIGRGSVISEESLLKALREGWIGGAILDVFSEEPLPASSELWSHPNVVITPHVAGPTLPDQMAKVFVDNMKLYMSGQPLHYVVDWEKGY